MYKEDKTDDDEVIQTMLVVQHHRPYPPNKTRRCYHALCYNLKVSSVTSIYGKDGIVTIYAVGDDGFSVITEFSNIFLIAK